MVRSHQLRRSSEGGWPGNAIAQGIGFSHNFAAVGDAGKALVVFYFDAWRGDLGKLQVDGAEKNQRHKTQQMRQPAALAGERRGVKRFLVEKRGGG